MPPSSGYYAEKIRENALELVVSDLVQEKEATLGWLPRHIVSAARTGLVYVGVVISQGSLQYCINREVLQRKLLMLPSPDGGPPPQSVEFEEESISSLSYMSA